MDPSYQKLLEQERKGWNETYQQEYQKYPPDYNFLKKYNPAFQTYFPDVVDFFLSYVRQNQRILELGSANGWFSLECARKGAFVDAYDIADTGLRIGRSYYEKQKNLSGKINWFCQDINTADFPQNHYDIAVSKGTLHHIVNAESVIKKVFQSLKPGGCFLVQEPFHLGKREQILIGLMLLCFPTTLPYIKKLKLLICHASKIPRLLDDFIEGKTVLCGGNPLSNPNEQKSPFENICSGETIKRLMELNFGSVTVKMWNSFMVPVADKAKLAPSMLKRLNGLDRWLTKNRLLKGHIVTLVAQKEKRL